MWIPLEPFQDSTGLSRGKQVDRAVCEQIADDGQECPFLNAKSSIPTKGGGPHRHFGMIDKAKYRVMADPYTEA